MNVDVSFVENKILKGKPFWTVKPKSSNSSGTSYYPSGGGKIGDKDEALEEFRNTIKSIWELNTVEPLIVTLKTNYNAQQKDGPFFLVPDDWEGEEPEDEPAPVQTRALSGVPSAQLTDAQLQKQGYVPIEVMRFELEKLHAQIKLENERRDFEIEKREHRRRMEEETAEIEAKHAKVDNWGHKVSRVAEKLTSNTKLTGNLVGVGVQAAAKVLGVDKTQLETLGAAIFSGIEATPQVQAQPAYPQTGRVETVEAVPVDLGAAPPVVELDPAAARLIALMNNPNLSPLDRKRILILIQNLEKNAQAPKNDTPPASAV